MRAGLEGYLSALPGVGASEVEGALELSMLTPSGLKSDWPSPELYGERLDRLAVAIAAALQAP